MIYQNLLMGKESYYVNEHNIFNCPAHRHPEIELSYCIKGAYDIIVDGKSYTLHSGELVFVKPMSAHEINKLERGKMLTIEVGPGLIGKYFNLFFAFHFDDKINKDPDDELNLKLFQLLEDTADILNHRTEFSELALKGNLFHICNLILLHFTKSKKTDQQSKSTRDIMKVEKAIQIIQDEYRSQLSIEYVCNQCGYSKSNFCRVFKKITGETFYDVLNRHRVEIACMHLQQTNNGLEDIAFQVGFADSKSFGRVFKNIMGITPGKYRKEMHASMSSVKA